VTNDTSVQIEVVHGDITTIPVDVIVNASNPQLGGGFGVNGAIQAAAGPGLFTESLGLGGCGVGEAKATGAHNLPAKYVIHTVGPVWQGGHTDEDLLLESCYRNSLRLACSLAAVSISFPAISTGVYGYPAELAAEVAVRAVVDETAGNPLPRRVILCCFTPESAALHSAALAKQVPTQPGPATTLGQ
jgi:O-acetyl-ADP-ribose deacetylase (regulator of RNase III)